MDSGLLFCANQVDFPPKAAIIFFYILLLEWTKLMWGLKLDVDGRKCSKNSDVTAKQHFYYPFKC